ncbi:MAG: hypothetical protein JEZ04_02010 [Spirochaetales bacterium]|nr:hypothetical protein [Spirochaetales bacterium]
MRIASLGVNKNLIVKSGLGKVQSGDILSIKIIENSKGRIKASIQGRIVLVKSSSNLIAGQTLRVKAVWKGEALILKQTGAANPFKTIVNELNLPQDAVVLNFFRTAARAGLVLKGDILKIIQRFLRNRKKLGAEEAGAAVELLKKGLYPEDMINFISGDGQSDSEDEKKKLLFNHLQDSNDIWIIVPFKFKYDSRQLEGSIRLKKRRPHNKTEKAVIAVQVEGNRLFFVIDRFDSETRKLYILSEGSLSRKEISRIKNGLTEILGNMRVEIDDNISENCFQDGSFDGFSLSGETNFCIEEIV